MKGIFVFILSLLIIEANAQGINFQGVSRSANGTILASSSISLRLSVLSKSVDATPEYVEVKKVVTNAQGIFSIVIGDGVTATVGTFSSINWANAPKFLKVEMDPSGGTSYINMGITQLQYVPYSFYSLGVAADNVTGVLSVAKGGTGVGSLDELKTALKITSVDTTSLSKRIDTKLTKGDTASLSSRIDGKQNYVNPGTTGNVLKSQGGNWVSSPLNIQNDVFASFMVDSTNMRLQNNSLSKLNKKINTTVSDSAEINNGNYAWYNIAIGDSALFVVDSGSNNIAIGFKSLIKNSSGRSNTSVGGYENLNANTTGFQNNAIGSSTMNANTTGNRNNSFGTLSMNANTTGYANSAFGNAALMTSVTGNENSSFGRMSTLNLKTGSYNSVFGNQALSNDTIGNYNTAIGFLAGAGLKNGSSNVFIGNNAGNNAAFASSSNRLVIANTNTATPLIYGEFDNSKLTVNGTLTANSFKIPGGTSAQYLRADGTVTTSVTPGVPYTGASQAVDLGAYDLTVNGLTVGLGASSIGSNTSIGNSSLKFNTPTGDHNTSIGFNTLYSNTTGGYSTSVGAQSLYYNTTGGLNTVVGAVAMFANTTGSNNTAFGNVALRSNTTGWHNSADGFASLFLNTTGSYNVAIGSYSSNNNSTGNNNTAIGYNSLNVNTTGSNNTALGYAAGVASGNLSNTTAIGNGATVTSSNTIQLGNTAVTDVKTTGIVTATGFKTYSGTSSQYLMADGSVSSGTSSSTSGGIPYAGATQAVDLGAYDMKVNGLTIGVGAGNVSATSNLVLGKNALINNTSGSYNTAIGYEALKSNTTASNNIAIGNQALMNTTTMGGMVAIGYKALSSNTTGMTNTAIGDRSLMSNTTGTWNIGIGSGALNTNTTGSQNIAIGYQSQASSNGNSNTSVGFATLIYGGYGNNAFGSNALTANTTGGDNSAIGYFALTSNTTGGRNFAVGTATLWSNTTGSNNIAIGSQALYNNVGNSGSLAIGNGALQFSDNRVTGITTGNIAIGENSLRGAYGIKNTAIGYESMKNITSAENNTVVGYQAGSLITTGVNNLVLGYTAQPSSNSVSNEITLGNADITTIRANTSVITSLSDRRDKTNINDLNVGLNFVNSLRPRTFNWDKREWYKNGVSDGSKISKEQTPGFIAQELDEVQNKYNASWLKLVYKSNPNKWEATYGNLLPVVVKSIQELSKENDELKERNKALETRLNKLEAAFQMLIEKK